MQKRRDKLFADIVIAADLVQQFTAGKSAAQFAADPLLRSAVERQLEIAGEAVRRLRDVDFASVQQLTNYQRIIDFRNVLAHGYDVLDAAIVWQAVREKLPALVAEVKSLQSSR